MAQDTSPALVTVPESLLYDYKDPFQYGWFTMVYFVIIWFMAHASDVAILQCSAGGLNEKYAELPVEKKKNVITYVLQFIVTTVAFVLQMEGSMDLLFRLDDSTTQARMDALTMAFQLVAVLYMWEIIYRHAIGWPLLAHHLMTILLVQLAVGAFNDTHNVDYVRFVTLLGLYATTEQLSFVALLFFRLDILPEYHASLFYASAVQTFSFKTIITIFAFGYYIYSMFIEENFDSDEAWTLFWKICFFPLVVLLYSAQVYAAYILYALGRRCASVARDVDAGKAGDGGGSVVSSLPSQSMAFHSVLSGTAMQHTGSSALSKRIARRDSDLFLSSYENASNLENEALDGYRAFRASQLHADSAGRRSSVNSLRSFGLGGGGGIGRSSSNAHGRTASAIIRNIDFQFSDDGSSVGSHRSHRSHRSQRSNRSVRSNRSLRSKNGSAHRRAAGGPPRVSFARSSFSSQGTQLSQGHGTMNASVPNDRPGFDKMLSGIQEESSRSMMESCRQLMGKLGRSSSKAPQKNKSGLSSTAEIVMEADEEERSNDNAKNELPSDVKMPDIIDEEAQMSEYGAETSEAFAAAAAPPADSFENYLLGQGLVLVTATDEEDKNEATANDRGRNHGDNDNNDDTDKPDNVATEDQEKNDDDVILDSDDAEMGAADESNGVSNSDANLAKAVIQSKMK